MDKLDQAGMVPRAGAPQQRAEVRCAVGMLPPRRASEGADSTQRPPVLQSRRSAAQAAIKLQ